MRLRWTPPYTVTYTIPHCSPELLESSEWDVVLTDGLLLQMLSVWDRKFYSAPFEGRGTSAEGKGGYFKSKSSTKLQRTEE